jgi:hypothetical protein
LSEQIRPEHKRYIERIRELWGQSGGVRFYDWRGYDLNPHGQKATEAGVVELLFDYGVPVYLCFAEGCYSPIASYTIADTEKFWRLLNEAYAVHIITPTRDHSKTSPLDFQLQYSGPLVALVEKEATREPAPALTTRQKGKGGDDDSESQ